MSLVERLHKITDVTTYPGEIPVNFKYTFGIAGEEFFRAIMEKGKFLASTCESCGVTYVPSRIFCERCMASLTKTHEIEPVGEVFSFTVCHQATDGSIKNAPDIIAAVKLDGADGVFVHYLGGVNADSVHIGMRVEAELLPKKDRKGGIHDIKCFMPSKK